jgi:hypothetical protein
MEARRFSPPVSFDKPNRIAPPPRNGERLGGGIGEFNDPIVTIQVGTLPTSREGSSPSRGKAETLGPVNIEVF